MKKLQRDKSVQIINLASDSSQESPLQILTSNNPNAFMYAQPENKVDSPSKREAKIDKIIQKITNSPKKATTEPEEEQIITIIPASTSTPIGNNTKARQPSDNKQPPQQLGNSEATQQQNTDKQTLQPTGSCMGTQQSIEHTSTQQRNKTNPPIHSNKEPVDPPEERQDTNNERENIHTEEEEDEYSGTSSISSLNTADIEALNKIEGKCGGGSTRKADNQVSHLIIKTLLNYITYIYIPDGMNSYSFVAMLMFSITNRWQPYCKLEWQLC